MKNSGKASKKVASKKVLKKKTAKSTVKKTTPATKKFTTVDEYISLLPAPSRAIAIKLRKTIKDAAPAAAEMISYNIPLYKQDGMLISFAFWKDHIGMYPLTDSMEAEIKELAEFKGAKHSLKFNLSKPLPLKLITRAVKQRLKENQLKSAK